MGYDSVDTVIQSWVARHDLTLFTGVEGKKDVCFRNVYVSSNDECCQIWVDPPSENQIELHAAGVETRQDEEFQKDWRVPITELNESLDIALVFVRQWLKR